MQSRVNRYLTNPGTHYRYVYAAVRQFNSGTKTHRRVENRYAHQLR